MFGRHENILHDASGLSVPPILPNESNPLKTKEYNSFELAIPNYSKLLASSFDNNADIKLIQGYDGASPNQSLVSNVNPKIWEMSVDFNSPLTITGNKDILSYPNEPGVSTNNDLHLSAPYLANSSHFAIDAAVRIAQYYLTDFFTSPDCSGKMEIAFGNNFDKERTINLAQTIKNGDPMALSSIKIVPNNILKGANGAFDIEGGNIYLSDNFVASNSFNPLAIADVVLEEFGHFIDDKINAVDSPGDEGEIFAKISQGKVITTPALQVMRNESDRAFITLNDRVVEIEHSESGNSVSSSRRSYTIKPGDTLSDVALREFGDANRWSEITKENGQSFSEDEAKRLAVGQIVYLPGSGNNNNQLIDSSNINTGNSSTSPAIALRSAIIGQESGYNYKAVNPDSGASGFAQIMPFNIAPWSREALGYEISPEEFLNSPELQLKIIDYKLSQYYDDAIKASGGDVDTAVRRVASAWYSGDPNLYNLTDPQYFNNTQYPSIADYTLSVLNKFHQA